jgi:GTP pyrophosphokinase
MNFFKSKMKRTGKQQMRTYTTSVEQLRYAGFGKEQDKLDYKLSACCNPIPGDPVFGLSLSTKELKFTKDCPNAISMQLIMPIIMQARWIDSSQQEFKAILNVTGMDTLGLTNELTKVISNNMHVNIQSISLNGEAGLFKGQVIVIVKNNTILKTDRKH